MCLVFLCSRLISRIARDLCAFSSGVDNKIRSAFVPHHRSTSWVATVPCCSVASVRKRLQASGIERSRRSEAKKLHSECCSCKSHNSRSFHAILCTVSSHTTNDLHAVLCRAISRISIVVSFCPMESCRCLLVVLLVVSMVLTVSWVTCELHGLQRFFSVFVVG